MSNIYNLGKAQSSSDLIVFFCAFGEISIFSNNTPIGLLLLLRGVVLAVRKTKGLMLEIMIKCFKIPPSSADTEDYNCSLLPYPEMG